MSDTGAPIFEHRRSSREEMWRWVINVVGLPIMVAFMFEVIGGGYLKPPDSYWVYGITCGFSLLIFLFAVIPLSRQKGDFLFSVTRSRIACRYPGHYEYELPMDSVVKLLHIRHHISADTQSEVNLVTADGKWHQIPHGYGMTNIQAMKRIRAAFPSIPYEYQYKL